MSSGYKGNIKDAAEQIMRKATLNEKVIKNRCICDGTDVGLYLRILFEMLLT